MKRILTQEMCDWDCSWEDYVRITKDGHPLLELELVELEEITETVDMFVFDIVYVRMTPEWVKKIIEDHKENWEKGE